ncbi:MAG: hypothetical protein PHY47_00120 [Lachnospiraceae bacterium]|nr:hypothetical protein [Lachnospiraceae bacterium]
MNKICFKCEREKDITNFSFKNKKTGKRNTICKDCHSNYRKEHYGLHIEKYKTLATVKREELRDRNAEYVFNYLLNHNCIDCNESNILVLEFDHRSRIDKSINISEAISSSWSLKKIQDEIDKCDVRCRNCHAIKTRIENNDRRYQLFLGSNPSSSAITKEKHENKFCYK